MKIAKAVTNEDILERLDALAQGQEGLKRSLEDVAQNLQDSMQMTSEGLDGVDRQLEGVNERMDGIEGETRLLKGEVRDLTQASYRHELRLGELAGTHDKLNDLIHIDIKEILHRLAAIEDQLPTITEAEVRKLQLEMQTVVDWVVKVSKLKNIAIRFPS